MASPVYEHPHMKGLIKHFCGVLGPIKAYQALLLCGGTSWEA